MLSQLSYSPFYNGFIIYFMPDKRTIHCGGATDEIKSVDDLVIGQDERQRADGMAVPADLVMKVRAGALAGKSHVPDTLAALDGLVHVDHIAWRWA